MYDTLEILISDPNLTEESSIKIKNDLLKELKSLFNEKTNLIIELESLNKQVNIIEFTPEEIITENEGIIRYETMHIKDLLKIHKYISSEIFKNRGEIK